MGEIRKDAAIELNLSELELRPPNGPELVELYRELGFSSLLKDLGAEVVASSAPASSEPALEADYAQFASVVEFREYLAKLPAKQPLAVWLNLEAGQRETEGFATHIASLAVSSKAGEGRSVLFDEKSEAVHAVA